MEKVKAIATTKKGEVFTANGTNEAVWRELQCFINKHWKEGIEINMGPKQKERAHENNTS